MHVLSRKIMNTQYIIRFILVRGGAFRGHKG